VATRSLLLAHLAEDLGPMTVESLIKDADNLSFDSRFRRAMSGGLLEY
jgi:hypothetical protein